MANPTTRTIATAIILALATALAWPAAAQTNSIVDQMAKTGTLRLGWGPWFPYAFRNPKTNQPEGIIMDIAKDMQSAFGVKVELVETSWGELVPGLLADKYDIVMPMYATPKRALAVGFTEPLTYHGSGFMVRKDDVGKFQKLDDLDKPGIQIAVEGGSASETWLAANITKASLIRVKDANMAILDLMAGRITALGHNLEHLKKVSAEYPDTRIIPYVFGKTAAAMIARQNDQKMINLLNVYITDLKAKGTLVHLLEKYGLDQTFAAQ